MAPDPHSTLIHDRCLRDIGTYILIAAIAIEWFIDTIWKEQPSAVTWDLRTWTEKFRDWWKHRRNILAVVSFVAVIGGIWMEIHWGGLADTDADRIVADATLEQTRLERLIAGRQIGSDSALIKLRSFAGTPIWVACVTRDSFPHYDTIFEENETFRKAIEEAQYFAASFSKLESTAKWKFKRVLEPIPESANVPGVSVYSWPLDKRDNAWAAADALVEYLKSDLKLGRTTHKVLKAGLAPFNNWKSSPPANVVIVIIGANDPEAELAASLRDKR